MKLFLSSSAIPEQYTQQFLDLFKGKEFPVRLAWITNAADPYKEKGEIPWIENSERVLELLPIQLVPVDLMDYAGKTEELREILRKLDGVWIAGGNTHYIRYAMRLSGFDTIIRKLLKDGLVYGGESAGAMVVAPNIELSEEPDELSDVPIVIEEGLNLYDTLILPHWDVPEYKENLLEIDRHHKALGRKTKLLTNAEAIVVNE